MFYISFRKGALLLAAAVAYGQTQVDLRTQSKSVDFSAANVTKPMATGNSLPATCSTGQMYFLLNAPVGQNLYACAAVNQWSLQAAASQLPSLTGEGGGILSTDGANVFWTGLAGDVTGTPGTATVSGIQGHAVSNTNPTGGQALVWNASQHIWQPQTVGGAGASQASQLTDFFVSVTNPTTLAIGASCSAAAPCNYRFGSTTYSLTAPASITLSGGTGTLYLFAASTGALVAGSNLTLACAAPCTAQSGVTSFPSGSLPLFTVTATSGSWNANSIADYRAFLSAAPLPALTGNAGDVLSTDGTNVVWTAATGDVTGSPGAFTVAGIQGRDVANTAPTSGQALVWSSALQSWQPQTIAGAGPGLASQLGDFAVSVGTSTVLTIGQNCSASTPCNYRFGSVTYSIAAPASITLSGGSGVLYFYAGPSGALVAGSNLTLACSAVCAAQNGITAFPAGSLPLFTVTATNGSWNANGVTDFRAFLSNQNVTAGLGLVGAGSGSATILSADSSVISLKASTPAASASSCVPGTWASDTSYYYLCVSANLWKRAALSSW